MTRAAILYAAKSTADVHGSIPTQLADSRAMAEREGFEVVAEYSEESRSGYRGNRGPQLAAARQHAEQLAAEGCEVAIFVQHSDRIARGDGVEQKQVIQYVWEARAAGYTFRSVQDDMTFTEATGLMAFVMGLRNHEDSKRKGAATSAGIKRRGARGRHHGRAPYGYRWLGTGSDRRLVVDESRVTVVHRIFAEFIAGSGVRAIAQHLDADGIAPPRAKDWGPKTVRNIIDSVAYIGQVTINGETFAGEHESIIDERTWVLAYAQRQARTTGTTTTGRRPNGTHLFVNGMLHCGECGGAMRARTPRGRSARYDCVDGRCSMRGVLRPDVDEPFLSYLEGVVFDVAATRETISQEHSRRTAESDALLTDAERELSQTEASVGRVRADYVRGALAVEDWEEFRRELTEQREATEHEIARLRARAEEVQSEVAAFDLDEEAASRLAVLRNAIAGEVIGAESLTAVRTALGRVFSKVTLVRTPEDELVLVPEVASFDQVEAWVTLPDGRSAVKPLPPRLAVPGTGSVERKQGVTDPS